MSFIRAENLPVCHTIHTDLLSKQEISGITHDTIDNRHYS